MHHSLTTRQTLTSDWRFAPASSRTDPEGISSNRLAFSVIVGGLTTSIVLFTAGLFLRELWHQLVTALLELQAEEDADEEDDLAGADDDEEGRAGVSMSASELMPYGGERHAYGHAADEAGPSGAGDGSAGSGDIHPRTLWEEAAGGVEQAEGAAAAPSVATPPPPGWTAQLSSQDIGDAPADALRA
jgi:hypothetical protein